MKTPLKPPIAWPKSGPAKARYVNALFARIVARYDLLNDLMTAGLHRQWKQVATRLARPAGALALDLGTGTGDLARELVRQGARHVLAADFVPAMLRAARRKGPEGKPPRIDFLAADALALPFRDRMFDCLTSGFLVRNVADLAAAFGEMYRVLTAGGRVVCLETSPGQGPLGGLPMRGFQTVAPMLGRVFARDAAAYTYLPSSAAEFTNPEDLAAIMRQAGFARVRYQPLALGLVTIHWGTRPA